MKTQNKKLIKLLSSLKQSNKKAYIFYCPGLRTYYSNIQKTSIRYTSKNNYSHLSACIGYFNGLKYSTDF